MSAGLAAVQLTGSGGQAARRAWVTAVAEGTRADSSGGTAAAAHRRCPLTPTRLACCPAGGHTAEMLALLQGFDLGVYRPRCYVTAATDDMSGQKAAAFEAAAASAGAAAAAAAADVEAPLSSSKRRSPGKAAGPLGATTPHKQQVQPGQQQAVRRSPRVAAAKQQQRQQQHQYQQGRRLLPGARSPDSPAKRRRHGEHYTANQQQYSVLSIPRSREVGQSFLSSVPTTLRALWAAGACSGGGASMGWPPACLQSLWLLRHLQSARAAPIRVGMQCKTI